MVSPLWIVGLGSIAAAISVAVRFRPPAGRPLRLIPVRPAWRYGFLLAGVVLIAFTAQAILVPKDHSSSLALQSDIALTLFSIGMAYVFWHAYRRSAVVITGDELFAYPLTLSWRDASEVQQWWWGIRVRAKPGGAKDVIIPRILYQVGSDDLGLLRRLQSSAA